MKKYLIELKNRISHSFRILKVKMLPLIVKTRVSLPDEFVFDEGRAQPRGRVAPDQNYYSTYYQLDLSELPSEILDEIKNFDSVLRLYFGGEYLISSPQIWRNIGLPKEYRELDIYSQVWHYDTVYDYRNVQLFILISDTTMSHGPFHYQKNADVHNVNPDVLKRNTTDLPGAEVEYLVGKRGDTLLFSTGSIPHRAGIPDPSLQRDMFSICFFPVYTNIGVKSSLLLGTQ